MNAVPGAARRHRTARFGAIAVAGALLTSACAAGQVAQTQNQRPSVSGANAQIGSIAIRNLTVQAPTGASYPKGSALRLTGVFVDNGTSTDLLTGISSPSFTSWGAYPTVPAGDEAVAAASESAAGSATPAAAPTSSTPSASESGSGSATPSPAPSTSSAPKASQSVRITAHGRTSYGVPDATGSLLALNTKSTIYPGAVITMTLTFARAGTVTVRVPVNIITDPTQSVVPAPSGSSGEGA